MKNKAKISVIGCGYVGLTYSILLGKKNEVTAIDISSERIDCINNKKNYLKDKEIDKYLKKNKLSIIATNSYDSTRTADFIFICLPTDFDESNNCLDTKLITKTIKKIIEINKNSTIVLKSTVPVGYTQKISKMYKTNQIIYSPEFLREKTALKDCLYPERIIIGGNVTRSKKYKNLIVNSTKKKDTTILYMKPSEAESVKLFSNAYLALRITYFNELDYFCEKNNLSSKKIINGVCLDNRIGNYYNNPSFGYGGYCLPKDVKELSNYYDNLDSCLIKAIDKSNTLRKLYVTNFINGIDNKKIGIYKIDSINDLNSKKELPTINILKKLNVKKNIVIIYAPSCKEEIYNDYKLVKDIDEFKRISDIIITNRLTKELRDVQYKVYTRDIFYRD